MKRTKAAIIIGDGLADRPVPALDGRTPLEVADTPTLDRIAADGECGQMDPIGPGIRAGSDTSHLSILGYDPFKVYTGRGPFEALGIGMDVRGGDICFRCNFASLEGDLQFSPESGFTNAEVVDRRAQRISEGTHDLAAAVNQMSLEDITCYVKESVEHRAALVMRGPNLGPRVSDVDPHDADLPPHAAVGEDEASRKTARLLNQFVLRSWQILKGHSVNQQRLTDGKLPANILMPRGAGIAPHLEPFAERYGIKGAAVVETGLIAGIGRYLQMTVPDVPGATGGADSDEIALAKALVEMLQDHDFVLCNFKAPDLGGHDSAPEAKIKAALKLDNLVSYVLAHAPGDLHLAITADHCTPIDFGDHTGDTVPIAIRGPAVRPDSVRSFGERAVVGGGLVRIRGFDLMPILTNLMGVQEKFGA
ncbi:MAG: 2,3-bisphosphoglycerate-independent phosphoglycerate mutase [Armatimonadota bacterium]|nr:MAG: 2,3-bisphosphoglycerate-independent phosphoglycerate mutase [Armatimonadota bacterium]